MCCGETTHDISECSKLNDIPSEERRLFVMRNALCFGCVRKDHRRSLCRRPAICRVCDRNHPTALHENTVRDRQQPIQQPPRTQLATVDLSRAQQPHSVTAHHAAGVDATSCRISADSSSGGAILPLVAMRVNGPHGQFTTYAFLDSGSTHSFISASLLSRLGVDHHPGR